jgi:hypothetical protein
MSSLRFSYFVCTVSENVRFTCNSRTIILLIVCDRSTDRSYSLLLSASKKAYRPLAGLTFRARHTHSLGTLYKLPLRFNFNPATMPRLTGIPSPHDLSTRTTGCKRAFNVLWFKTKTISVLMQHMFISTNHIFSLYTGRKIWKFENIV